MEKGKNHNIFSEPIMKFFEGKNFAFLGTINKDGSPQVTPTWVDIKKNEHDQDGFILINTAKDRLKHKNVTRDSRVSVSLIDETNPYTTVTVKGRVVEQTTDGADEHIDKLAKKYLDVDAYPFRSSDEKRVILKIKPDKVFYRPP
ncbi:MAG TPA: PPOX class F420-dependent oxidoreductase [Verrucomicrobiae bacterium]|nr:PPOX class F420-dependent oxidoreductase [Verrucomicrobiae bacterium]